MGQEPESGTCRCGTPALAFSGDGLFRFRWAAVEVTVVPGNVWRVSVVPRVTARLVDGAVYCLIPRYRGVVRPKLGCRLTNCFILGLKTRRMII